jgi:hypothetical protein
MMPVQKDIIDSQCVWSGQNNEYRYVLRRVWDVSKPKIAFVGLNPSVASEQIDDNTVRKCINIAKQQGFGKLVMLNAYGYRSTDPLGLKTYPNPEGTLNDRYILQECETSAKIVVAWGSNASDSRHSSLLNLLERFSLWCFAKNKDGKPKHPLYVPLNSQLILYKEAKSSVEG